METVSLAPIQRGFRVEMDLVRREEWYRCLSLFDDANIHQAWDYESAMYPRQRVSRLVLFDGGGEVAGMAQVACRTAPLLGRGIARVRHGPVWRRKGASPDPEALSALAQALREEFVSRRKLLACIVPQVDSEDDGGAVAALEAQGFTRSASFPTRTIILDLSPPAEEIRAAFSGNWRRHLGRAEGNGLEVIEGTSPALYARFLAVYRQMMERKQFDSPDVLRCGLLQRALPEREKMRVFLACHRGRPAAALVVSAMGNTGLFLLGATSHEDVALHLASSYLLQWRAVQWLKAAGYAFYDLGHVNPERNPGCYQFKNGMRGRHVTFTGEFVRCESPASRWLVSAHSTLRSLAPGRRR